MVHVHHPVDDDQGLTPALSLKDVCKSFGAVVVADSVNFELPKGQTLGVLGPNGAGKTTLFNLITGTLSADTGSVFFEGNDVTAYDAARRCRMGIARSFQIPQPFGGMSVFENVLVGAWHGACLPRAKAQETALEVLDQTGLSDKVNQIAGKLTLLDRKRLELARALAAKPKVLLLDEIAGGLTEHECQQLIETIKHVRNTGVSIIWIEHIVHALLAVVDRLIVVDFGKIVADGKPTDVMSSQLIQDIYMGPDTHA